MRRILKKKNGGPRLKALNETPPIDSKGARKRWNRFRDKSRLTLDLKSDQFGLCVYTELSPNQVGLDSHVEHVKPKSKNPALTFDYSNLAFCALSSEDLMTIPADQYFGGHFKEDRYDEKLFISSVSEDSSVFFFYSSTGQVVPEFSLTAADKQRAVYTIELLNLNCPFLVSQRRKWIGDLQSFIDAVIDDPESLRELACQELLPTDGELTSFFTATKQVLGPVADEVLINPSNAFS